MSLPSQLMLVAQQIHSGPKNTGRIAELAPENPVLHAAITDLKLTART